MRTVGTELYRPANQSNEPKLAEICNKLQAGMLILSGTGCTKPLGQENNDIAY